MKALFLGGDKRQLQIIYDLYQKGITIDVVGYENATFQFSINKKQMEDVKINEYDIVLFPVSGVHPDLTISTIFSEQPISVPADFLVGVKEKSLIFTGIRTKLLNELLRLSRKEAIALMEDDKVKEDNAIPTVEGVIGDLVNQTEITIHGSNIFVIGYGNLGKKLFTTLRSLGANVSIGVKDLKDFSTLRPNGIDAILTDNEKSMKQTIGHSDIIINTAPSLILDAELLREIKEDTYLLDISSFPYGIDVDVAQSLPFKSKIYSGIPGVVAPKTAGKILSKRITSLIREES